jgi:hypothetical protein
MKKLAIVLSLVMVLAFGASVMAAEIKTTGYAQLSYEKGSEVDNATWGNKYRVQFDAKVDDNSGVTVRFEGTPAAAVALKRANYWVNFPGLGKVVAGHQYLNNSVVDQLDSNIGFTTAMISFAPALPEGFKAVGFFVPSNIDSDHNKFGVQGSYDAGVASVYGSYAKSDFKDVNDDAVAEAVEDGDFAIGVNVPILKDVFSAYAEYNSNAQLAGTDPTTETVVGGKFSTGGFDFIGEYATESETVMLEAYKTVKNVELNLVYSSYKDDTSKLQLFTTLYF